MSTKNTRAASKADRPYEELLAEESLILTAQMMIQRVLNERGMTQADLARKLGVGESHVSQMLGCSARNLTLRTIARVMHALDAKPTIMVEADEQRSDDASGRAPVQSAAQRVVAAPVGIWGEVVELESRRSRRRAARADGSDAEQGAPLMFSVAA